MLGRLRFCAGANAAAPAVVTNFLLESMPSCQRNGAGVLRLGGAQSRHIERRVQLEIPLASYGAEIICLTCITGLPGSLGFIDTHPAHRIYRELRLTIGIIDEPKCFLHI